MTRSLAGPFRASSYLPGYLSNCPERVGLAPTRLDIPLEVCARSLAHRPLITFARLASLQAAPFGRAKMQRLSLTQKLNRSRSCFLADTSDCCATMIKTRDRVRRTARLVSVSLGWTRLLTARVVITIIMTPLDEMIPPVRRHQLERYRADTLDGPGNNLLPTSSQQTGAAI